MSCSNELCTVARPPSPTSTRELSLQTGQLMSASVNCNAHHPPGARGLPLFPAAKCQAMVQLQSGDCGTTMRRKRVADALLQTETQNHRHNKALMTAQPVFLPPCMRVAAAATNSLTLHVHSSISTAAPTLMMHCSIMLQKYILCAGHPSANLTQWACEQSCQHALRVPMPAQQASTYASIKGQEH